jgi:hypothetical protein
MSWLDRLLGREKKPDKTGADAASMPSEGMQDAPEPAPMTPEAPGTGDQPGHEEQDQPPAAR